MSDCLVQTGADMRKAGLALCWEAPIAILARGQAAGMHSHPGCRPANMHNSCQCLQLLSLHFLQVFEDMEVIRLSVGGVSYTTTVATLRNAAEPSLFTAMFSGRHTLRPDEVCHAVQLE